MTQKKKLTKFFGKRGVITSIKKVSDENKFQVKKQNSSNRQDKLPLWVQNIRNKIKRSVGSPKGMNLNPLQTLNNLFLKKKQLIFSVIIILLSALVISAYIFINNKYNQIKFETIFSGESVTKNIYTNKNQNILFINFKESSDGNNLFAQYISILSFNKITNELKILSVEPLLVAYYKNKSYSLQTLINNINENDQTKVDKYQEVIEDILGLRLDGYIYTKNNDFGNFIKAKNFSINVSESFKTINKFYKTGDPISGDDLLIYLGINSSEEEVSKYQSRDMQFITNILQNNRNIFFGLSNFLDSQLFTQTFKTNIVKEDAIRFYNDIFFNASLPFQSDSISLKDGYMINITSGQALNVNTIDIDTKVQNLFRDLTILREQAKFEVLNASSKSGLASHIKKIIQNSGCNVVNSGNYPVPEDETTLYVLDSNINNYSNTIAFVKSLYPNVKIKDTGYKYNRLGNIILVLGEK